MAHISDKLRAEISERAKYHCEYCKRPELYTGMPHEIDHINPESKGGATDKDNLALACGLCNGFKGDAIMGIDPITQKEEPLFNPRTQEWAEHFEWSQDSTTIIGLTSTGRATVERLCLNFPLTAAARAEWCKLGWMPPTD